MDKITRYNNLVKKISECPHISECSKKEPMTLCECCNEVNLWTYWEGGRDRLDAKILVVGQDWGKVEEDCKNVSPLFSVEDARFGTGYMNMICDPGGDTDDNLCVLFESIGIPKLREDLIAPGRKCKELFFTNFVCCYRKRQTSGAFDAEWVERCKDYFVELVQIIEPEIIICLGRNTYDSVRVAFGEKRTSCSYNETILGGCEEMMLGNVKVSVFPMAHPGAMGTLNRCKAKDNLTADGKYTISKERGLELQKNDWKPIKELLDDKTKKSKVNCSDMKPIIHRNMFGSSCDIAGVNNPDDFEIYCRKEHKLCAPCCDDCEYFAGSESGFGIACLWDDVSDIDGIDGYTVQHSERYKELERVDKLIK